MELESQRLEFQGILVHEDEQIHGEKEKTEEENTEKKNTNTKLRPIGAPAFLLCSSSLRPPSRRRSDHPPSRWRSNRPPAPDRPPRSLCSSSFFSNQIVFFGAAFFRFCFSSSPTKIEFVRLGFGF